MKMARNRILEYAKDVLFGKEQGLTNAQIRRHAAASSAVKNLHGEALREYVKKHHIAFGDLPLRALKELGKVDSADAATLEKAQRAGSRVAVLQSESKAAKEAGISVPQLRRLNDTYHWYAGGGKAAKGGIRANFVRTYSVQHDIPLRDGTIARDVRLDAVNSSKFGRYMNARAVILEKREDPAITPKERKAAEETLRSMKDVVIRDIDGKEYRLLTNENAIMQQDASLSPEDQARLSQDFDSKRHILHVA